MTVCLRRGGGLKRLGSPVALPEPAVGGRAGAPDATTQERPSVLEFSCWVTGEEAHVRKTASVAIEGQWRRKTDKCQRHASLFKETLASVYQEFSSERQAFHHACCIGSALSCCQEGCI